MSGGPPLVHVGLHKTGSTWLQQRVFPHISGFENAPALALEIFSDEFDPAPFRGHGRLLLSNEAFSGDLWDRGDSTERYARRLAEAVPGADVLMLVRNQPEMLVAVYAQYVNEGGSASFARFLSGDRPGPSFELEELEYDRVAEVFGRAFGADRVWIHAYELMRRDPHAFLRELCERYGVSAAEHDDTRMNVSLSPLGLTVLRGWNRAFRATRFNPSPFLPLPGGRRVRTILQTRVDPLLRRVVPAPDARLRAAREVASCYAESNVRLAAMSRQPLRDLGYPWPSAASYAAASPSASAPRE